MRIAAIFLVFVAVLCAANNGLLLEFYEYKERSSMKAVAEDIDGIDLYSKEASTSLSEILSGGNYTIKIKDSMGNTMFTSFDSPVADYKGDFFGDRYEGDSMLPREEGFYSYTESLTDKEWMTYVTTLSGGEVLQISVQTNLLKNSARVANEFIAFVSLICLTLTLLWVLYTAKSFTKPINEMNEITKGMATLDFSRKLTPSSCDEIGQLAVSINTLSDSLDETLLDLEEKNRKLRSEIELERRIDKMRKGFVADVSHELKTPISIISGYAEGIKVSFDDPKRQSEYADIIVSESARMNELVLGLLELSRLESGNMSITPEVYDIAEQISLEAKKLEGAFLEKRVKFSNQIRGECLVFADKGKILKIINNYLSNALSHVTEEGEIRLSCSDLGDFYKILVFNEGEKIPYDKMEHIWESFYRGEESHKREQDRFGLGLSIVKATTQAAGLSCGVQNTSNGVIFWFTVSKPE